MNKNHVNNMILTAKEALDKCRIATKDGVINSTFRGQISSFGAAIVMGSLPAAVAFFTEQGGASVERQKLPVAIYYCLYGEIKTPEEVLRFVCENNSYKLKEAFTEASIALKLAMNFYKLESKEENHAES